MITLNGLTEYCGKPNQPGLITIEYTPVTWINPTQYAQIILNHNWQKDIAFINGVAGWLKAKVLPTGKIWNEKHQREKQGPYYQQSVRAIVPNLMPAASGELMAMDQEDYLLRLVDQSNVKWLLGTMNNPFQFFADGTTGSEGDLKHHAIRFEAKTPNKAFGLEPAF